jgi:phage terminase large subunit
MERDDPQRYEVEGKGSWGVLSGLVYSNWHIEDFDHKVVSGIYSYGGDFGYVNSYTGLIQIKVDTVNKQLYVCKEIMYAREVVNSDIADAIKRNHMENEVWIFDCAEMKSIAELKRLGIRNAKPCAKGKDSVMYGISCIKEYKIIVHPDCVNTINELQSYMWKQDGNGKEMNEVIKDYDHILDAIRYAIQPFHKDKAKAKAISTFGLGI